MIDTGALDSRSGKNSSGAAQGSACAGENHHPDHAMTRRVGRAARSQLPIPDSGDGHLMADGRILFRAVTQPAARSNRRRAASPHGPAAQLSARR